MILEISTGSYNDRRYGKPWIAKVTFETSQGAFRWGDWVGQPGDSGLLLLDAEPGDVVARGQKDFRKPKNSAPEWYVVTDGGTLQSVSKAEAYKMWRSK